MNPEEFWKRRNEQVKKQARVRGEEHVVELSENGMIVHRGLLLQPVTFNAYIYPKGSRNRLMMLEAMKVKDELKEAIGSQTPTNMGENI